MPRALSATITAATTGRVTSPQYLVELEFSQVLRYSTHHRVEWDGKVWQPNGVEVEPVSATEARIALRNADNSVSALVLSHKLAEVPVRIYAYYDGDAALVFTGTPDGAPEIGARVVLPCVGHSGAAMYPTERIGAPEINFLTPSGTTIRWGNGTLELEVSE